MNAMVGLSRVASSSPVLSQDQGGTEAFRISAEIVRLPIIPLPKLRDDIRRAARDLFWQAFPGDSLNAKSKEAARLIQGVDKDTFARIYNMDTDKIDSALMQVMLAHHFNRHGFIPDGMAAFAIHIGQGGAK